jgi:hypothetical protein|tara:strand:- start:174 stop:443 length:270 start_codon:yes stop_codon:yes gene_type:complete
MANATSAPSGERVVSISENGSWTTKTIVANTIGELRIALDIPNEATVNVQDQLYTDNSSAMPTNELNDDGTTRPLCIGWVANNKTGGTK